MKLLIILFVFPAMLLGQETKFDFVLKNGKIIDGSGNSWFYSDVAIRDGKIVRVAKDIKAGDASVIDASGLLITPGFIDVHTHIEGDELKTPTADNFIMDGVTSVVTGNCGASKVNISDYLRFIDSLRLSVNVATLLGHNDLRRAVIGNANRAPNEEEMQKMESLVTSGMLQGAVGLSTGLIYIPGTYSKTDEIVRLAKIASKYNGLYASHMRDEGDSVLNAIDEAITIGREAKIPVEISHFKLSGQRNWGRSGQTLRKIIAARSEGLDVTIDQYPYTASSTSMSTMIPDAVLADGPDSVRARLQRPETRKYVVKQMLKNLEKRKLKHFSYAVVAYHKADTTLNGKSVEAINLLKGKKHKAKYEAETVIDMMLQGGAGMVFHGMSDEDVEAIMRYPFNMFASDASIREFGQGKPHPRGYGTNARVLSMYVRDKKVISMEEAIRRMTSLPAQKFGLKNRGLIREGMMADIVLFDENKVADRSTYENPHQFSSGFQYVIVNGQLVVQNGKHTGVRSGAVLYGPAYEKNSY
ncbi:MAG: D-aminoacylase [Chitinophagaceae bacterium]|nr:MAG: D-aminoacylase [Chitinophagaceae bacterium]